MKPEAYGDDAVVVSLPGTLDLSTYRALLWGAATGRLAAIIGATPATSMEREGQVIKLARAMTLYIVGRPTQRTGFFWTCPRAYADTDAAKLLEGFQEVASMDKLDLGKFVFTNYNLSSLQPGCQVEEGTRRGLNGEWPIFWKQEVARAIRCNYFKERACGEDGYLRAMSPEQWKEHVRAGHYPARRDCLQCVVHGATGHRRARIEYPSLFCLKTTGEDPSARGDRAKAARMKYLLVAKFSIPESYATGKFEPTGCESQEEDIDDHDPFEEEAKEPQREVGLCDGDDGDPGGAVVSFDFGDADEDYGQQPEDFAEDTGAGVGPIPMDVVAHRATHLLFAEPLLNDTGPTIASAIQSIVLYLQSLNIPVLRFHSDRAAQLTARPLVQWLHQQAIRTSTSTPGVPQGAR